MQFSAKELRKMQYPGQVAYPFIKPKEVFLHPKKDALVLDANDPSQSLDYLVSTECAQTVSNLWALTKGTQNDVPQLPPRPKGFEYFTDAQLFIKLAKHLNHGDLRFYLEWVPNPAMHHCMLWLAIHYAEIRFSVWFGSPRSYIYITCLNARPLSARFRTVNPLGKMDLLGRLSFSSTAQPVLNHWTNLWTTKEWTYLLHIKPLYDHMYDLLKEMMTAEVLHSKVAELIGDIDDIVESTDSFVEDVKCQILPRECTTESGTRRRELSPTRYLDPRNRNSRSLGGRTGSGTSPAKHCLDRILFTGFHLRRVDGYLAHLASLTHGRRFTSDDDESRGDRVHISFRGECWRTDYDDG